MIYKLPFNSVKVGWSLGEIVLDVSPEYQSASLLFKDAHGHATLLADLQTDKVPELIDILRKADDELGPRFTEIEDPAVIERLRTFPIQDP